jgi:hypothetical protein
MRRSPGASSVGFSFTPFRARGRPLFVTGRFLVAMAGNVAAGQDDGMSSPRPWTVLPHGPVEPLAEGLWTVEGDLPYAGLKRRMTIVRLPEGGLAFHNAIPLREADLALVERHGRPALLLVPNGNHRLDVHAWKERFPRLTVLCPAAARERVATAVRVDGTFEEHAALRAHDALAAIPLDGSKSGEAAIRVRTGTEVSLLFGDTVFNVPHQPGIAGLLLRLVGSSGGARVTRIGRLLTVRDPRALAAHLERLAATPGLARLVPSHGDVVRHGAPETLRAVARRLAAS